ELAAFHCPMPPVLSIEKIAPAQLRQETVALRHFSLIYVGLGSDPVIRRCRLNVRFAHYENGHGWAIYEVTPYVHVRYLTCAQPGAHVPQPPSSLDARRRTL